MQRMGGGSCGEGMCALPPMGGGGRRSTRKNRRTGEKCGCSIFRGGRLSGGGCPCAVLRGGRRYRATAKNRAIYRRWKQGKSIGFTATSHLKAIGMIPRTSRKHYGKRLVSKKYQRR